MVILDYNKYEKYIRVGHTLNSSNPGDAVNGYNCVDLADFPTPSGFGRTLHDVDLDAFTDLEGYTQRNRIRNDVEDIALSYNVTSDNDIQYILNRIQPEYIYVELVDKKTQQKKTHKMYASDKSWNVLRVFPLYVTDDNGYVQYTDGENLYWYDEENDVLYNTSYIVVTNVPLYALTKVASGNYSEVQEAFGFSLVEQ